MGLMTRSGDRQDPAVEGDQSLHPHHHRRRHLHRHHVLHRRLRSRLLLVTSLYNFVTDVTANKRVFDPGKPRQDL